MSLVRRKAYVVTWFHRTEHFLGGVSIFRKRRPAENLVRHIEGDPEFPFDPRLNRQGYATRPGGAASFLSHPSARPRTTQRVLCPAPGHATHPESVKGVDEWVCRSNLPA
jgi:hypothetical protein